MMMTNRWQIRMQITWSAVLCLALLMVITSVAAQQQETPILEAMDVSSLPGNRVQIRFQLSQSVAEPRSFTINQPARIVLDFLGTKNGLQESQRLIGTGLAEQVSVLEGGDRTRASVNLAKLVPYTVRAEGNTVLLTLEAGSSAAIETADTARSSLPVTAVNDLLPKTVGQIDFRRGPLGEAIITVVMSDPGTTVDVREEGDRIVADFVGARFPPDQERRLDVTDFATPVTLVDALNRNSNARVSVRPLGMYEYLAYQTDDRYTIEVKPVKEEEVLDPAQKTYTGELLSLNFQDIEVRAVLQIIADFTGLNVVVSDTVSGNLTLRLQNVPWDQALDIILRTKGLTQRQNGNVIYIAPTEEVAAREKLELEASKEIAELAPLRSELIQVNYAKAADISSLLKQATAGSDVDGGSISLLSARGNVTVDSRTNTLLVQDTADKIVEIRRLVTQLDVPVRQVMIDSRVVIANSTFGRDLGIRIGGAAARRNGDNGIVSVTGSAEGNDTVLNSAVNNLRSTGQAFPTDVPSLTDRLGVNLPAAASSSLAFAILGKDFLLDLELTAMQAEGRGEILSNPRVITTDRSEAKILQGREIPYSTISQDGVQTAFKEALLQLQVTPQITPDNRIIMDLNIKKDEQGQQVTTALGSEPTIDRREVNTQVLVDDGETVVLGGVFEQILADSVSKTPILGDIPLLGNLFRNTTKQNDKNELLIFVTPQIVGSGSLLR